MPTPLRCTPLLALATLCATFSSASAQAPKPESAIAKVEASVSAERIRAQDEFVSDDLMEG
ncbi:MAG: hypothetical protein V4555_16970, partial [Acidobacteriota bacterium]